MSRSDDLPDFDSRPGIRLVNTMPEHPKVVGLSDGAFRLWVELLCYCSRQETDGLVPAGQMKRMARQPKLIKELVTSGLVDADSDYRMHDYLRHQRSSTEIQSFREAKSTAGQLGNHKRWHVPNRKIVKDCPYCLQEVASA